MMERFLERISLSDYKDRSILKGGMLVVSMVGLDARSTMDLDATVKGTNVNVEFQAHAGGTLQQIQDAGAVFDKIEESPIMEKLWQSY